MTPETGLARWHRRTQRVRGRLAASLLVWLCLALPGVQMLGLLHAHSHLGPRAEAAISQASATGSDAAAAGLFAGHDDGGTECRLFDQLLHADLLTAALAPTAILAPAPPACAARSGLALARQAAGYLARGPPRA